MSLHAKDPSVLDCCKPLAIWDIACSRSLPNGMELYHEHIRYLALNYECTLGYAHHHPSMVKGAYGIVTCSQVAIPVFQP
ncbi:MAG: hypothetical protein JWM00_163 [Candidatus Saccharibacteria bacterium]|nr:hypothetical protein [Candidatus Saccharibacteria bacterium]